MKPILLFLGRLTASKASLICKSLPYVIWPQNVITSPGSPSPIFRRPSSNCFSMKAFASGRSGTDTLIPVSMPSSVGGFLRDFLTAFCREGDQFPFSAYLAAFSSHFCHNTGYERPAQFLPRTCAQPLWHRPIMARLRPIVNRVVLPLSWCKPFKGKRIYFP